MLYCSSIIGIRPLAEACSAARCDNPSRMETLLRASSTSLRFPAFHAMATRSLANFERIISFSTKWRVYLGTDIYSTDVSLIGEFSGSVT